jgi:hypothetical protein
MKKITLVAVSALIATTAFAGDHSIRAEGRMSWIGEDRDNKATGIGSSSELKAEWARVIFNGKLDAATTYNVDVNLAANTSVAPGTDNTGGLIDEVFITRTLAEGTTLDIGKKPLNFGGIEASHLIKDEYASSAYYGVVSSQDNEFGLTLNKEFAGQVLSLQYFNGNKNRKTGPSNDQNSQTKYGYSAQWVGSLANGMIKPNVGYVIMPKTIAGQQDELLGAGFVLSAGIFSLQADYGSVTNKKQGTNNVDKKKDSISGVFSYVGHDLVTPFAKYIADTDKTNNDGTKKSTTKTYALGFEFKESKTATVRYHAVYSSAETKYASTAIASSAGGLITGDKKTIGTILIGAKFETSIL